MVEQNFDLGNKKLKLFTMELKPILTKFSINCFLNGKNTSFRSEFSTLKRISHSLIPVFKLLSETQLVLAGNHETAYGEFVKKD